MAKTYWRNLDNERLVIVCDNQPFLWEEISEEEYKEILSGEDDVWVKKSDVEPLVAAVQEIFREPHGCPFCDSGILRNSAKGHRDDCGFELARLALENVLGIVTKESTTTTPPAAAGDKRGQP